MELLRFGFVGAINTISTLVLIFAVMTAGANVYVANFLGYAFGLCVSFLLNLRWTFKSREGITPTLMGRFLAAAVSAYFANLLVVHLCLQANFSPYFSQAAGLPTYSVIFYLVSKFFVFRNSPKN